MTGGRGPVSGAGGSSGPGGWAPRRFWGAAHVVARGGGFGVTLDSAELRTPARAPLVVPTRPLAQGIAAEWEAQQERVNPETMPLTRAANSAIDRVAPQHAAVAAAVASYGETDLLCHRAERPEALCVLQAQMWDPPLRWLARAHGVALVSVTGVMPAAQPPASLARLHDLVTAHDAFALTALHDLVVLTGSLVLGLSVSAGRMPASRAWDASRVDEEWQISQWGEDDEARAVARARRAALLQAEQLLSLLRHVPG